MLWKAKIQCVQISICQCRILRLDWPNKQIHCCCYVRLFSKLPIYIRIMLYSLFTCHCTNPVLYVYIYIRNGNLNAPIHIHTFMWYVVSVYKHAGVSESVFTLCHRDWMDGWMDVYIHVNEMECTCMHAFDVDVCIAPMLTLSLLPSWWREKNGIACRSSIYVCNTIAFFFTPILSLARCVCMCSYLFLIFALAACIVVYSSTACVCWSVEAYTRTLVYILFYLNRC